MKLVSPGKPKIILFNKLLTKLTQEAVYKVVL